MRLWSRGLGRLVLPLELGSARLDLTADHVVLSGVIREGKVVWDYSIKLTERDFLGFSRLALEPEVLGFLARTHGLGLLRTIARGTIGFAGGLLRKALGRGAPIVSEQALPVGPGAPRQRGTGRNGVLVERAR
jgi:hypothetical protein